MIELRSIYNGTNNGAIFLSVRDAAARLGLSCFAATIEAFDELRCAGLISMVARGAFNIKPGELSKAHVWRLNWIVNGKEAAADKIVAPDLRRLANEEAHPADAFAYFSKIAAKARKRQAARHDALDRYLKEKLAGKFAVEENSTLDARRVEETSTEGAETVEEIGTVAAENAQNPSFGIVEETSAYIGYHSQGPKIGAENLALDPVFAAGRSAAVRHG